MSRNTDSLSQTAQDLSADRGAARLDEVYRYMQRGLVYPSPYANFLTFFSPDDDPQHTRVSHEELCRLMVRIRKKIHSDFPNRHTTAIVGVSIPLWRQWCTENGWSVPKGMDFLFPSDDGTTSTVYANSSGSFKDSGGILWFHIKSLSKDHAAGVADYIQNELNQLGWIDPAQTINQAAASKSQEADGSGGKILGRRFSENLNNPSDPITVAEHALVGYEDPDHMGASFALSQRFIINWGQIHAMSAEQIEDIIGRRATDDTLIPSNDERTHIKSARVRNAAGNTTPVLRLGLPYGQSPFKDNTLAPRGYNLGDEKGLYFAGFTNAVRTLEQIMDQMIGHLPDEEHGEEHQFMRDRVFNNVKSNLGGFFYIPSRKDLKLKALDLGDFKTRDWSRFPGVDWSRLDRHFKMRSENGRMFYNHKDYLYGMATASGAERAFLRPPSIRILTLLADSFSLWQDNWYFNRKQEEIGHLRDYLVAEFGEAEANRVMAMPILERKGWAVRMSLRLFTDDAYGFRGERTIETTENGETVSKTITGADTYHIHPQEIIVGAMPNLGLGQGTYVMRYLTPAEDMDAFLAGYSEASGVGHVIPDHSKILGMGLDKMIAEIDGYLATCANDKKPFYASVKQSLIGYSEYCERYADLAGRMADEMPPGRAAEADNLRQIQERMKKLAHHKPDTMAEAAQQIFTTYTTLQLVHEPTSIGRLDQMLQPYYDADVAAGRLTEEGAQEILDAFWVKMSQKIQQNRMMVEDHQPLGNMAMGGVSGPYPQGSSNNQWLMQVTVGGTVADNQEGDGKPAYNHLTKLCLRAAARLPMNAPCLSLRTRKDMPDDIIEEAAMAVLSGGAHPIFMNDEKIIPAMHASGAGVGGNLNKDPNLHWDCSVELKSARNYACDGCYEPQFTGENWFTLGGFTTLNPLEAALNMGKTYALAGPTYFRGQNASFNSRDPSKIASFQELWDLYFEHFRAMFIKANDFQLLNFAAAAQFCPGPLLSAFTVGCVEKGMDYYAGGSRYHIVGPCFVAVSNTVNSLYAIKSMVFDPETAVTSLPELVQCLICDWGNKIVEPFFSSLAGPARTAGWAERYKRLREHALTLPRYGRGHAEIDAMGDAFLQQMAQVTADTYREPVPASEAKMRDQAERFGTAEFPFGYQIQPGIGTFEGFCDFGVMSGASADGRLCGTAIASDMSPAPSPMDQPPQHQEAPFIQSLDGFTGKGSDSIADGAPVDINIRENYPQDKLQEAIRAFADGKGSNIMTITCASPQTFEEAVSRPEKYDLLRVRMGGWSEYFTAMFPYNQQQHLRRPLNIPDEDNQE